jgi:hypothetical protein
MAKSQQMQKQAVQIGPLTGGLNNVSKAGEARDTEVVDLINLEVTLDQALTSRPAIEAIGGSTLPSTNTIGWDVLGIYRISNAEWYLVVTVPKDGTTNVDTTVKAYLNGIIGPGETILTIKQSVGLVNRVQAMVQFNDKLYFCTGFGASENGFSWKKGDAVGGTSIAAMPKGNVMISWKTRIWVAGTGENTAGDRIKFSTIDGTGPHPDQYAANDFFDVEPGSGGFITAMIPSFNNLIIFKNDGTWRFSYASEPAQGIVDKISGAVGCASKNAVCDFENYLYVYDQGRVYELVNSGFTQVNRFVFFDEDEMGVDSSAPGVEISIVNRRLLVRYFNALYSFNVDTKAWSRWRTFAGTPGRFFELPTDSSSAQASSFVAASKGLTQSISPNFIVDNTFADPDINAARDASPNITVDHTLPNLGVGITWGAVGAVYQLNTTGDTTDYEIPVSVGQQFDLVFEISSNSGNSSAADVIYLLRNGSTQTVSTATYNTTGVKTTTFTVPANAILARIQFRCVTTGTTFYKLPSFTRKSATAAFNMMRIVDEYPDQVNYLEYIECSFQTKSYDYRTPGNFKRLYWGGIDVKTTQKVYTECRPVSTIGAVLWNDLEPYTHDQLEAGSWDNPLDWLGVSFAVFTILDSDEVVSENGRYFKKIGESMRFRQISYKFRTSTFGNLPTGPVKFFSLTTYIGVKQEVVDSSS